MPAPLPARFAAFREPTLLIDRLGVAVDAPVTIGSAVGPDTLWSEKSDVVRIAPDGRLIAMRAGVAIVRSTSGDTLRVDVRPASGVVLTPERLVIAPGGTGYVRLLDGAGDEIPSRHVHWTSSDPRVAVVRDGSVHAAANGVTQISAAFGGSEAKGWIHVKRTSPRDGDTSTARDGRKGAER